MIFRTIKFIALALMLTSVGGCAVSTDGSVMAAPAAETGRRIEEIRTEENLPTTIAIMPFSNDTDSEFAFEAVRQTLSNHFATTNYRWLHWRDVDNRLALAGIENPAEITPAAAMELLGVDGVMFGNITHFNKTFAGIYAQIAVGVELNLYNAAGDIVWQVDDVRRSHAGGVSTSPVGLIMNALTSANHLRGDLNLYRAADDLGRDLVESFPQPSVLGQRDKPAILDIVHSGAGQYLKYGDTLEIAIDGDAGMTAAALIEGLGIVDLEEVAPGQYSGSVVIARDINLADAVVEGRLQDDFGQSVSWISPYGLLNIDNTPPAAVTAVSALSKDGAVELRWEAPAENDLQGFEVSRRESRLGRALGTMMVMDEVAVLTGLTNFRAQYVSITAVDRAGNTGDPVISAVTAAPDPRVAAATQIRGTMPEVISGVQRLTADNSPYRFTVPTRVATDGVLLIDPGVTIEVGASGSLTVLGEMHGFGEVSQPIRIVDVSGQGYAEFLTLRTERPVSIKYAEFSGGGLPLQILAGRPLIEMTSFLGNRFSAMSIKGTARPTIRACLITGAGTSGVIVEGQAQPVFTKNRFENNQPFHLQNGSVYQVNIADNEFEPAASNMTVLGNVLLGE